MSAADQIACPKCLTSWCECDAIGARDAELASLRSRLEASEAKAKQLHDDCCKGEDHHMEHHAKEAALLARAEASERREASLKEEAEKYLSSFESAGKDLGAAADLVEKLRGALRDIRDRCPEPLPLYVLARANEGLLAALSSDAGREWVPRQAVLDSAPMWWKDGQPSAKGVGEPCWCWEAKHEPECLAVREAIGWAEAAELCPEGK